MRPHPISEAPAPTIDSGTPAHQDADRSYAARPGFATRHIVNRIVAAFTRAGISVYGTRILAVRGRTTGHLRTTPVNPLNLDGRRYLVSARGHMPWTKNMRAAGEGSLRLGRRTETFTATEVADDDKPEILRAYLRRWGFEVGAFFEGVDADAAESDLRRIAPRHPVFLIEPARAR